ncbi:MAG: glycosyltransferase family 39 protein [Oscillospiraceae bacterium]|nr:glycosyltransferase family 39 protein [Oscillospiraceae bacterium]
MKTRKSAIKPYQSGIIFCIMPLICFIIFRSLNLTGEADMKILMRAALGVVLVYAGYQAYKNRLDAEKMVYLILIAGIILRIGYTLYTHAFTRGYDIGMNDSEGVGHWGYIYQIVNGHLPPSNEYQFYQPPLYYMVSAFFIRIMMLIKGMNEWGGLEYIPQLVSCVCSVVVMLTTVKIMDGLKIKKTVQIIPTILLAVYPMQIMTAGRTNNDSMVQMFTVLALYFTLRWHKSGKLSDIIGIALAIGLGMMTKISCAVIAFVTGPIMIYHFIKIAKTKDRTAVINIIRQFAVFAVICFPLGLWYGIRNYILFDQPLNFVHELPISSLYNGEEPFADVWIKFPLFHFKDNPYLNMGDDSNVWMILIKSGVHAEFEWDGMSNFLAWIIDYAHLLLCVAALAAVAFVMIKDRTLDKTQKFSAFWVWALTGVSFVQFNIAYPYSCTADFRYVLVTQIAASFFPCLYL